MDKEMCNSKQVSAHQMILYELREKGGGGRIRTLDTDWKQLCLGRVHLPSFDRKYAAGNWMRFSLHLGPGGSVSSQMTHREAHWPDVRFWWAGANKGFTGTRFY